MDNAGLLVAVEVGVPDSATMSAVRTNRGIIRDGGDGLRETAILVSHARRSMLIVPIHSGISQAASTFRTHAQTEQGLYVGRTAQPTGVASHMTTRQGQTLWAQAGELL